MNGPAGSLRLALFSDGAAPLPGGDARATLDRLVHAIRDRGGDVRLFSSAEQDGGDDLRQTVPSVPFWSFPELRITAPARARTTQALAAWRPTLVHAAAPFGVGLAGRGAARALGVPYVTSYQPELVGYATNVGLAALRRPGWALLRWFHNGGARTYCPSRAAAGELRAHGIERLAVWSPGVDVEAFHPAHRSDDMRRRLGADDGTFVVASSARLARGDGFDVACRVMRLVQQTTTRRIVWAVAGSGPEVARCRAAAPPDSVFVGLAEGGASGAFYASADLFLSTAVGASVGEGVLESMASGVPVLAAGSSAARELLAGMRGATATGSDVEALAVRLISLAGDARERAVLREHALAFARRRSWLNVLGDLVASFERITRDARARARAARPSGEVEVPRFLAPGLADVRPSPLGRPIVSDARPESSPRP
jgi:glycosyltransferase involved in cell wall biosynthesis